MSSSPTPVYFEESWAILSSIGIVNILFGIVIINITSLSPISLVPIVVSAASAIANGLCYYAYYASYPRTSVLIAAVFADITWLVQEAGLCFYSYLILTQLLHNRPRLIYISLFWTLITTTTLLRISILACRAHNILTSSTSLQPFIAHLHIGYFLSLALIETLSSYFLLRKLSSARRTSMQFRHSSTLFNYLMRSTQIRLTILMVIGGGRAVTYSFQRDVMAARGVVGQVDRFLYLLECLFPVVMFIDILASKLVITNQSRSRSPGCVTPTRVGIRELRQDMYFVTDTDENLEEASARLNAAESVDICGDEYIPSQDVVNVSNDIPKTTDFEFLVARVDPCL